MTAMEKAGVGKLIIWVRSARDLIFKRLLVIHKPEFNPKTNQIFAVANSVILI